MTVTKRCSKCGETKPLDEFHVRTRSYDGVQAFCKPCMREANQISKYGVTTEAFHAQLEAQEDSCVLCGRDVSHAPDAPGARRAHIDHDHETGKPRGILCLSCNTGLGKFNDDPARLRAAAAYLEDPPWKT